MRATAVPKIEFLPMEVLTDGGSEEGRLVLADGCLAAVVVSVSSEEAGQASGWFLEAGFGSCGILTTAVGPVFPSLADVEAWVSGKLGFGVLGGMR